MRLPSRLRAERLEDRCTPTTFTVTSLADAGAGTLRAAIALAEADLAADTIVFDPSVRGGTINLTTFDTGLDTNEFGPSAFIVTTPVTIQGSGETIRRDAAAPAFRLFAVLPNRVTFSQLTLSDLELTGGLARGGDGFAGGGGAGGFGGAIYNAGQLTLGGVTVTGNTAQGGNGGATTEVAGGGGGVGQSATNNLGGGPNGGSQAFGGLGGNGGGGAANSEGNAGAGGFGGGGGGNRFGGSAGAGGFGGGGGASDRGGGDALGGRGGGNGDFTTGGGGGVGLGGGVFNNGGIVSVVNSTFSGNSAVAGGGGSASAQALGGGLFNLNGTVTARSATFADNIAADGGRQVFALALGQVSGAAGVATTDLTNSISGQADVLVTDVVSFGSNGTSTTTGSGNLIRTATGFTGGVVSTADPLLATLGNNGGLTRTRLPQAGSPAIDALPASAAGTLTTDQRGFARVFGGGLDIGAVEVFSPVIDPLPPPVVPPPPLPPVSPNYLVGVGTDVQVRSPGGELLKTIPAYTPVFAGGLFVAYGDVTGDGVADEITGAGQTGDPHVIVFDGATGGILFSFYAFDKGFLGGVSVATADLNGDGIAELVVGAGPGGGPHVKVFDLSAGRLTLVRSFYAFSPEFGGGVRVGAVRGELVAAAGPGGGPHVKVFRGLSDELLASFYAFTPAFLGGASATAGDLTGDGVPDIVVGAGKDGGPHVTVYDGATGALVESFYAYDPQFRGGVRVALADVTADGSPDYLFGAGPGGGPHVIVRDGHGRALLSSYFARPEAFPGGVTVG